MRLVGISMLFGLYRAALSWIGWREAAFSWWVVGLLTWQTVFSAALVLIAAAVAARVGRSASVRIGTTIGLSLALAASVQIANVVGRGGEIGFGSLAGSMLTWLAGASVAAWLMFGAEYKRPRIAGRAEKR
jgi:hypothetical protein